MNTGKFAHWPFEGADKVLHGMVTFFIMLTLASLHLELMGIVLCIIAMLGKELWDMRLGGDWSWGDIYAGTFGMIVGAASIFLADRWYFG